jgi:hypothetical protein
LDGRHALPAGAAIERCSGRGFLLLREHGEGFPSPKSGWLRMAKPLRGAQGQQDNLRQGRALPTRSEKQKPRANLLARAGSEWGCANLAPTQTPKEGRNGMSVNDQATQYRCGKYPRAVSSLGNRA